MADLSLPADDSTGWGNVVRAAITRTNKYENLYTAAVVVETGDEVRPEAAFVIWIGGTVQPTNMAPTDLWAAESIEVEEPPVEEPEEPPAGSWIARSEINAARNGTTAHSGAFTPATSGSLLVMIAAAPAIMTVAGWTRVATSLDGIDLGVWTKTATTSEASVGFSMGAPNYPLAAVVYEFVAGTVFQDEQHGNIALNEVNPTLSGLTGTNVAFGVVGKGGPDSVSGITWTDAVEDTELIVAPGVTDGITLGVGVVVAHATATFAPTGAVASAGAGKQAITFAVKKP